MVDISYECRIYHVLFNESHFMMKKHLMNQGMYYILDPQKSQLFKTGGNIF